MGMFIFHIIYRTGEKSGSEIKLGSNTLLLRMSVINFAQIFKTVASPNSSYNSKYSMQEVYIVQNPDLCVRMLVLNFIKPRIPRFYLIGNLRVEWH